MFFGNIPYDGISHARVTLPWHQDPRHTRHQLHHTDNRSTSSHTFTGSPPTIPISGQQQQQQQHGKLVTPFFLPSYHSPTLSPQDLDTLRFYEINRAITTLRLLGYDLQPGATLTDALGHGVAALCFFHHFTDPNQRVMALLACVKLVLGNVESCVAEAEASGDVRAMKWRERVLNRGWGIMRALEELLGRFKGR